MSELEEIERDLAAVLNRHGVDAASKTPDYILAAYVISCISALTSAKVSQAAHENS